MPGILRPRGTSRLTSERNDVDPLITLPSRPQRSDSHTKGRQGVARPSVIPFPTQVDPGEHDLAYQSHAIDVDRHGRATCQVTLASGPRLWLGEATGCASEDRRVPLVGRAAVDAVSKVLEINQEKSQNLNLHGVKEIMALGRCFVLVAVQAVRDREAIASAGVSEVEDSREAAVIAATLQATDRWVRRRGRNAGATRSP